MKKTISTLAILKIQNDHQKIDYIENFLPFLATLIVKKQYTQIESEAISKDFQDEFGIGIPSSAIEVILLRAKKRGLIAKTNNILLPVFEEASRIDFSRSAKTQIEIFDMVVAKFIDYALKKYDQTISIEHAEDIFIAYLKKYDTEILFASKYSTILPDIKLTSKNQDIYIFNKFFIDAFENSRSYLDFIYNVALGYMLASFLLYDQQAYYTQKKFKGIEFYLDTEILFRLLGTEGKSKQLWAETFVESLKKSKVILNIYSHTIDEIKQILYNCLKWNSSPEYDPSSANTALIYFKENNYSDSDIELMIHQVDDLLVAHQIYVLDADYSPETASFQIDESRLREVIIQEYKKSNPRFNSDEKKETIDKDIRSISSVFRKWRGLKPSKISDAPAIFVTTNSTLAHAVKLFTQEINSNSSSIAPCITLSLIETIFWLQTPSDHSVINKKIISDCYGALKPSDELLSKYCEQIGKLKQENKATPEQIYFLKSHRLSFELLSDITRSDPALVTSETPDKILQRITIDIEVSTRKRLKDEVNFSSQGNQAIQKQNEKIFSNIDNISKSLSSMIATIIFVLFVLCVIGGIAFLIFPAFSCILKIVIACLDAFFAIIGFRFSMNFKVIKSKLRIFFKTRLKKLLLK